MKAAPRSKPAAIKTMSEALKDLAADAAVGAVSGGMGGGGLDLFLRNASKATSKIATPPKKRVSRNEKINTSSPPLSPRTASIGSKFMVFIPPVTEGKPAEGYRESGARP